MAAAVVYACWIGGFFPYRQFLRCRARKFSFARESLRAGEARNVREGKTSLIIGATRVFAELQHRIDIIWGAHTQHKLTVQCGHTHGGGEAQIRPNLHVITGPAEYGLPVVQQVFAL